jgi:hypothetical protein
MKEKIWTRSLKGYVPKVDGAGKELETGAGAKGSIKVFMVEE